MIEMTKHEEEVNATLFLEEMPESAKAKWVKHAALGRQLMEGNPEEVFKAIRELTEQYWQDYFQLQLDWQDKQAGEIWRLLALELEKAVVKAEEKWQSL